MNSFAIKDLFNLSGVKAHALRIWGAIGNNQKQDTLCREIIKTADQPLKRDDIFLKKIPSLFNC